MKYPSFDVLFVLFATCLTPAAAIAAGTESKAAPSQFEAMDADRDGRVSAHEHASATKAMFLAMDANDDGKVTLAEMDTAHEKLTGGKASEKEMSSADKIKEIDNDHDGILTADEHEAGSRSMFKKMDADKNDHLSKAEWIAGHAALMKKPSK